MDRRPSEDFTRWMRAAASGDSRAAEDLWRAVHAPLRQLARAKWGRAASPPIEPTALVSEVWLRLSGGMDFPDRSAFFRAAASAMRHALVEEARSRGRLKRGGGRPAVTLHDVASPASASVDVLDLDEALGRLTEGWPRAARVVELRAFAGLTIPEVATALGIGRATVERDWRFGRAWLRRALEGP